MSLLKAKYLFTQGKLKQLPQQPTEQATNEELSGIDLRGEQVASSQGYPNEPEEPQAEERMKPQNVQYPNAYQGKTLESIENGRQAVNAQQNVSANDNQPKQSTQQSTQQATKQPTEQPTEQATNALDDALAERDKIYGEQIKSFEDLLKYYKHETPEEKARRERRERIERSATAAIDLAGALGNLGVSMSNDGRSVKWNGTSKAVKEEQEQQRKLREQDNAKAKELQNTIMALRKARAEGRLSAAQAAEALKLKREALANDNFKFKTSYEQKERHHAETMDNAAKERESKERMAEKTRKNNIDVANIRANSSKKGSGATGHTVSVDIGNGEYVKLNTTVSDNNTLKQQLLTLIPKEYLDTYSSVTGISLQPDINGDVNSNSAWAAISGYLRSDNGDNTTKEKIRELIRAQTDDDGSTKPKKREQAEIPSADEDPVQQHMNANGAYGYQPYGYQPGTKANKPDFSF